MLATRDEFEKLMILVNSNKIIPIIDSIYKSKDLKKAQTSKKPTVISCKTKLGFGSPNKSGKASSHGSPLGIDEIKLVRKILDWDYKPFKIPHHLVRRHKLNGLTLTR